MPTIKFYWHAATSLHLHIIDGYFCTYGLRVVELRRDHVSTQPDGFIPGPLQSVDPLTREPASVSTTHTEPSSGANVENQVF